MGRHSITSHSAHRALGVAGIVGFVALALCCDANVLTSLHILNKFKAEESLIGGLRGKFHPSLGDKGTMPDLNGAIGWLNSAPLSAKTLRGKVVLVDFWTYTSFINSLIVFRFHSRDLHLIIAPTKDGKPIRFRVPLDGAAPGENCGVDTVPDGSGQIREPGLYQLIRQKGPIADRTFEIEFLDPGVQALDFTFG